MKTKGMISIMAATLFILIFISSTIIVGCAPQSSTPATPKAPAPATPPPSATTAGAKTLKWSYNMAKSGAIVRGWEWFATEFEKQTNGRYKIDFYPSESLVKDTENLEAIVNGVTEIINCGLTARVQQFTVSGVLTLPSTHFPDTKEGHIIALDTAQQLLAKYPAMSDEFKNFKLLTWNTLPANLIMSKSKKIVVPDDLKGVKVGTRGADKDVVQLAGGAPVTMAPPLIYEAMDKGVIDAATASWIHLTSNHYEEVAQYYLDITLGNDCQTAIMGWNAWNALPADVQKIFTNLLPETMARSDAAYVTQVLAGIKLATDKNRTITTPNPDQVKLWGDLSLPIENAWLDKVKAKGITDGPAILAYVKQRSAEAWSKNK